MKSSCKTCIDVPVLRECNLHNNRNVQVSYGYGQPESKHETSTRKSCFKSSSKHEPAPVQPLTISIIRKYNQLKEEQSNKCVHFRSCQSSASSFQDQYQGVACNSSTLNNTHSLPVTHIRCTNQTNDYDTVKVFTHINECMPENSVNIPITITRTPVSVSTQECHYESIRNSPNPVEIVRRHKFRHENFSNHTVNSAFRHSNKNGCTDSMEQAIRRSNVPINVNENEQITAHGQRGLWINKNECQNWKGPVSIDNYKLNYDPDPEIIYKENHQPVEYTQDIMVRYLKPPTPPPPGDIIIREQPPTFLPPAPPLIIRQHEPRPKTPEPLIIREQPPKQPCKQPTKIINIPGRVYEPPPRRVIIERLPPLPPKPQPVQLERWLPYKFPKRRIVYEKQEPPVQPEKPRNLIVEWQQPEPVIKKSVQCVGVEKAEPAQYLSKYGSSLVQLNKIPYDQVLKTNEQQKIYEKLAEEQKNEIQLEGDVEALKFLDLATLEREGLGMYKHYLNDSSKISSSANC